MKSIYEVPTLDKYVPISKKSKFTRGRMTTLWSNKTGRTHYFWSKLMESVFYYLEYSAAVDIREAFPLIEIANALSEEEMSLMSHYRNKTIDEYHQLTTSFLITMPDGSLKAIATKYSSDLKKKESIRFIHLQKRFWSDYYGIEFSIVTEKEVDLTVVQNLKTIREIQFVEKEIPEKITEDLFDEMRKSKMCIKDFCEVHGLDQLGIMTELRKKIFSRELKVDLHVIFSLETCLVDFIR